MKKDKYTEKQFIEYLDRLLAGEEISLGDDVSDEVRSALELARKMLAYRDEPSSDFRASLRDRLLRQLAEKQAATQPEVKRQGFGERLANIFPPRPVLVAVTSTAVVVLLAFIGVVWFAGRFGGVSAPSTEKALAPPPAEYSVRLPTNIVPPDVTFTSATSLSTYYSGRPVFKIERGNVTVANTTELGRRLGFGGEARVIEGGDKIAMFDGEDEEMRELIVWTASGAVEYGYVEPDRMYPQYSPDLPSQQEAELIAYDFLQQSDLLPPGYYSLAEVKDETTVIAGGGYSVSRKYAPEAAPSEPSAPSEEAEPAVTTTPPATTYWLVEFPIFIDGASTTGPGSKIELTIGNNGEVLSMHGPRLKMSPICDIGLITEQQAYEKLVQGKGSLEVPLDCKQVVIEQVQIKYWLDPISESQDYALPVFEFKGVCLDKNGRHLEDFTAWTEALYSTY